MRQGASVAGLPFRLGLGGAAVHGLRRHRVRQETRRPRPVHEGQELDGVQREVFGWDHMGARRRALRQFVEREHVRRDEGLDRASVKPVHRAVHLPAQRVVTCGDGTSPEFLRLLTVYNQQRHKTDDELFREALVLTNLEEEYATFLRRREE